jgi:AraC-like DNA-binding protein
MELFMKSPYFKYVPSSPADMDWGTVITVAGFTMIEKGKIYPPPGHPRNYNFNWEHGRILLEYQLIYIAGGEGTFETGSNTYNVKTGDVLMLFPNQWHRYSPNPKTGWTEYYVGLKGPVIDNILKCGFIKIDEPVFNIGEDDMVIQIFKDILESVEAEKSCFQQETSGAVLHLLGHILKIKKDESFKGKNTEDFVKKAKFIMLQNLTQNIDIEQIADELMVGYSRFRKEFKKYTGMSPLHYHNDLRLQESRKMLAFTEKSIKQIAIDLGYESDFYFSRLFKAKTGNSPTQYRKACKVKPKKRA